MRAAGCIANDMADRHFDGHVQRTQFRPLVTGRSVSIGCGPIFILIFCSFLLVLFLNPFTLSLAFVGVLLAVIYPFLKRFTHLPQLGLDWPLPGVCLWPLRH